MSANSIRNALGLLQDDPDRAEAWAKLREALGVADDGSITLPEGVDATETMTILERARASHASRKEHDAVAGLLACRAASRARGSRTFPARRRQLSRDDGAECLGNLADAHPW